MSSRPGGRGRRDVPPVVLAISYPDDAHAVAVLAALDAIGAPVRLLDLADFPHRATLFASYASGGVDLRVRPMIGKEIHLGNVGAAWWRRPRPFDLDGRVPQERRAFAEREWREAILGLWRSMHVPWVNDPFATDVAALKTWQLTLAGRLGFALPRTLVTSDRGEARAFLRGRGSFVCKTLHADPGAWQPTRRVGVGNREAFAAIRHTPVVFQEHVPGVDVRVTVVGRRTFPVEIDARRSAYPDDFRVDFEGSKVRPCRLPATLERRILGMARSLGLSYAAFDLRRRRNGEHVFLEVNPAGQWLLFEQASGLPVTDALARLLASAARRPTARPSPWLP